ncbi:MAG: hypothetical protein R3Y62_07035 [Eubacteriales bacterium]
MSLTTGRGAGPAGGGVVGGGMSLTGGRSAGNGGGGVVGGGMSLTGGRGAGTTDDALVLAPPMVMRLGSGICFTPF